MESFVKLHKKILHWGWYSDVNTTRLFIHCLLRANYVSGEWHGIAYGVGEFITSLPTLAKETGLTIQQVRTALSHLKSTGEITDRSTNKYRIISINNWNEYQVTNRKGNRKTTDNQQIDNRLITADIEEKKYRNIEEKIIGVYIYSANPNEKNFYHLLEVSEEDYVGFFNENKDVCETVISWMRYKDERKPKNQNHYEETGLNTLLRKVRRVCIEYGNEEVIRVIENSMSSNYTGIVWEKLKKRDDANKPAKTNKASKGMMTHGYDFSALEDEISGKG